MVVIVVMLLASLGHPGVAGAQSARPAVDDNKLRILLRTAIVALNHANRTGNYTVLRDLGTPSFRNANTSARLAGIFAKLRAQDLDFGPILVFEPVFTQPPAYTQQGLLRLTGFFPTRPLRVVFDLSFQFISKRWHLQTIAVTTSKAPPAAGNPAPPAQTTKSNRIQIPQQKP